MIKVESPMSFMARPEKASVFMLISNAAAVANTVAD
jgi:hypothetical protein